MIGSREVTCGSDSDAGCPLCEVTLVRTNSGSVRAVHADQRSENSTKA